MRPRAQLWQIPFLRLAAIPIAIVPRGKEIIGPVLEMLFRADLNISVIDEHSLTPFAGVPSPVTSKDGSGPVYFDGVEAMFTVSHNAKGKEHITLERIDLQTLSFTAGPDPDFSYRRDGEASLRSRPCFAATLLCGVENRTGSSAA